MKRGWQVVLSYRYGIAVFGYAIVVLLGSIATRRHAEGRFAAAATLVPNHRITTGDVRRPFEQPFASGWYLPDRNAMEGKYVVAGPINACAEIPPASVEASPNLQPSVGLKLVALPLPAGSQLSRILDSGSVVEVVSSQDPEADQAAPDPAKTQNTGKDENTTPDGASEKEKKKKEKGSAGGGASPVQPPSTATVHAILCDPPAKQDKNPPTCYAILDVSPDLEKYVSKEKNSIRLAPKTIAVRDTCNKE